MAGVKIFQRRDWLWPILLSVLAWAVLVTLFTAQVVVASGLGLKIALKLAILLWLGWAIFAPLTVWLSLRFPLERGRFLPRFLMHMIACGAAVTASQLISRYAVEDLLSESFESRQQQGPPPWVRNGSRVNNELTPPPWVLDKKRGSGSPASIERKPAENVLTVRIMFDILIYWCIMCGCQALIWSRRARRREARALAAEASLVQARLEALQMQLNPHFLFNSLNAIATLVHTDPNGADEMLGDLGTLLRASLDNAQEQEVSLRQELDFLGTYLALERVRFGTRLTIEEEISPDALEAKVPTFILQPIVENAVRHGIEPQQAEGIISLSARIEDQQLSLSVSDSGTGLGDQSSDGIGLANTRARLEQLYGEGQWSLMICNREKGGCIVSLKFPFSQFSKRASREEIPA